MSVRARSDAPVPTVAPTAETTTASPTTPATALRPPTSAPARSSAPAPTGTTTSPFGTSFAYQPLFPFGSLDQARRWQQDRGGHQPWHADAEQTALGFVGYLGYTGIDRITSHTGDDSDAEVGVGYETEGGRTGTAAIVHLLRFGNGADAPWEVVGTADTSLTLTEPIYGATITSPISVGGPHLGLEEAIHAEVRQLSSAAPLGESCCTAAGGDSTPWHATVSFYATDRVLMVSVSTGGHLKSVERFAVTAVRTS